ncbi:MAG TPA: TauD/TfdA family dioxygenase [Allosphingosinicella sp.]|nr:TauD/TfdA family dioxygenase [Allosphingosinicella sp.]
MAGETFEVRRLDASFGVEISGLDLSRPLAAATRAALVDLFHRQRLLLFRSDVLSPRAFLAFVRQFGEPDGSTPHHDPIDVDGFKGLRLVSNIEEDGKAKGQFGNDEMGWHQDRWTDAAPPPTTILHGVEITRRGGATGVAGMIEAYAGLPADPKARVEGRTIHFSLIVTDREGKLEGADPDDPNLFRIVPLVQRHAVTDEPFLFMGARRILSYIDTAPRLSGLSPDESAALLDALYAHLSRPAFTYAHHWRPGDLLMWDNRCCMHRREAFDAGERRLLYAMPLVTSDCLWAPPPERAAA